MTPKCAIDRRLARLPGSPVVSTASVSGSLPACLFTAASPRSSLFRLSYPRSSLRTSPVRTSSSRSCDRSDVRFCKPWIDKKLSRAHWQALSKPSSASTARHSAYALRTARWSDRSLNDRRARCASSRIPVGTMKGSLEDMQAAAVSTGSRHCVTTPMMSMRPVAGSSGSCESRLPSGVSTSLTPEEGSTDDTEEESAESARSAFSSASARRLALSRIDPSTSAMAPSVFNRSIASVTVSSAGGSMASARNAWTPELVIEHVCRHVASSAVR
mmetsp:Transcript_10972/g.42736  ORF Transcript_10972/g.42736 Transcript_10972/m.42736 type:complete len:272 (-) Transcript_10972:3115-3930(-)